MDWASAHQLCSDLLLRPVPLPVVKGLVHHDCDVCAAELAVRHRGLEVLGLAWVHLQHGEEEGEMSLRAVRMQTRAMTQAEHVSQDRCRDAFCASVRSGLRASEQGSSCSKRNRHCHLET